MTGSEEEAQGIAFHKWLEEETHRQGRFLLDRMHAQLKEMEYRSIRTYLALEGRMPPDRPLPFTVELFPALNRVERVVLHAWDEVTERAKAAAEIIVRGVPDDANYLP